MIPCTAVKLLCIREPPAIGGPSITFRLLYSTVYRGMSLGYCKVAHVSPVDGCLVTAATKIIFGELYSFKVEYLEKNVLVKLIDSTGNETPYVYPRKVWERVWDDVLEPLMKTDERLRQQGAIFYGPPGTGKTSMAEIMAKVAGLEVVTFTPDKVLSKYVGETENKAMQIFKEAEKMEPSMVLMDDAEWATTSRGLVDSGEASRVYTGLMDLMLAKIEEWNKSRRKVIAVVTTNVSEAMLDPALRRGGRLGTPIYIPLPDVEAVRIVLEEYGVASEQAEKWAIRIVNAGLPMADAVFIAREIVRGRRPRIEPKRGIGYRRHVPPELTPLIKAYVDAVKPRLPPLHKTMKLRVAAPEPVAIPIALVIASYVYKAPAVVVSDPRKIDNALTAAETAEGFLILPTESMPPETHLLAYKADKIIYAGAKLAPGLYVWNVAPQKIANLPAYKLNMALTEIIYKFYGIEYDSRELKSASRIATDKLLDILANRIVCGAKLNII